MSRTLKWVLGILAVLVVLAVIAGAVLLWQYRSQMMSAFGPYATRPNQQVNPGPNFPNGRGFGFGNNGRNGYGFRMPMMPGMGRMMRVGPFGFGLLFLGGLLRFVVPVILLVLVAVLFYQLGKRSTVRRVETVPAPPAPPADQNPPQTS